MPAVIWLLEYLHHQPTVLLLHLHPPLDQQLFAVTCVWPTSSMWVHVLNPDINNITSVQDFQISPCAKESQFKLASSSLQKEQKQKSSNVFVFFGRSEVALERPILPGWNSWHGTGFNYMFNVQCWNKEKMDQPLLFALWSKAFGPFWTQVLPHTIMSVLIFTACQTAAYSRRYDSWSRNHKLKLLTQRLLKQLQVEWNCVLVSVL